MHTSSKSPSSDRSGRFRLRNYLLLRKSMTVRSAVVASVLIQLLVSLCLSAVVALVFVLGNDWQWSNAQWTHVVSVWVGGGIAVTVTIFGVWRALWRRAEETDATRLLVQLYSAEFGKLLMAGLLLGLAFKQLTQLHSGLLIGGFALAYLAGAVGMAVKGFKVATVATTAPPK
ncbi:MAG: ATP synthase subunit I [Gammaproteobacteria bacterium]|nr:ATP synthase subunit I [Gammaproteobacteria bacterium]MBT8152113.1 ATP synthase subunit I [Gammaproteobacteria bacterium]NNM12650.1 hypothetical protein [Pseudomonadales bacterium]